LKTHLGTLHYRTRMEIWLYIVKKLRS
jgi:hypothetical protein